MKTKYKSEGVGATQTLAVGSNFDLVFPRDDSKVKICHQSAVANHIVLIIFSAL